MTVLHLLFAGGVAISALGAQPRDQMDRLKTIIGTWDVEDVHQPLDGPPSRELGVRVCQYALRGRYIECRTTSHAGGREREYVWFITYDADRGRFDLVAMFSNYWGKDVKSFRIDDRGTWQIRSATTHTDGGVERWYWATLTFDGADRAVWMSYRNAETDEPVAWATSSRETWVRRR